MAGEETDYLFVPWDGDLAPYYISEANYEDDGTDASAGGMSTGAVDIGPTSTDKRKSGEYVQISANILYLPRS